MSYDDWLIAQADKHMYENTSNEIECWNCGNMVEDTTHCSICYVLLDDPSLKKLSRLENDF